MRASDPPRTFLPLRPVRDRIRGRARNRKAGRDGMRQKDRAGEIGNGRRMLLTLQQSCRIAVVNLASANNSLMDILLSIFT